jgi:hypothetical protein
MDESTRPAIRDASLLCRIGFNEQAWLRPGFSDVSSRSLSSSPTDPDAVEGSEP